MYFVYDLVYANLVAALGLLVVGMVLPKLARRELSLAPTFALCFFVVVPLGILIVQALLTGIGFSCSAAFLARLLSHLARLHAAGASLRSGRHGSRMLRDRVQVMEQQLHEKQIAEERSRKLAAETRLRSLESWIHPHFLFNTLNSISALIAIDPARAEQIVGRLATLLRASLDTSAIRSSRCIGKSPWWKAIWTSSVYASAKNCADRWKCRWSCGRPWFHPCRCSPWWRTR